WLTATRALDLPTWGWILVVIALMQVVSWRTIWTQATQQDFTPATPAPPTDLAPAPPPITEEELRQRSGNIRPKRAPLTTEQQKIMQIMAANDGTVRAEILTLQFGLGALRAQKTVEELEAQGLLGTKDSMHGLTVI